MKLDIKRTFKKVNVSSATVDIITLPDGLVNYETKYYLSDVTDLLTGTFIARQNWCVLGAMILD